jgi:hypothetical protein
MRTRCCEYRGLFGGPSILFGGFSDGFLFKRFRGHSGGLGGLSGGLGGLGGLFVQHLSRSIRNRRFRAIY